MTSSLFHSRFCCLALDGLALPLGHLLRVQLLEQRAQGLACGVAWVLCFPAYKVADGGLTATANGCDLWLAQAVGLYLCDSRFPIHDRNNIGMPIILQAEIR